MVKPLIHPSREELQAYSRGLLSEEESLTIDEHISQCEVCCETIVSLSSDDSFIELLQEAKKLRDARAFGCASPPNAKPTDVTSRSVLDQVFARKVSSPLVNHSRYEIMQEIGHGGMGRVYQARHRMMDREVAVKVINREWVQKQEAIDRFHREVKTAASLDHPNIVTAYDAEQANDLHFLVMEFVDGTNLAQTVKRNGPLPVAKACDYVRQAAEGLQYAHDKGMVHRDIKPHNLIVTKDDVVKIVDFGLASLVPQRDSSEVDTISSSTDLTVAGAIMGTPDFISPEQSEDARNIDGRSDIYSLGMTLYFLLAGRVPFEVGSPAMKLRKHMDAEPAPLETLRDDIPESLSATLARMITKNPDERLQSPAEVAKALASIAVSTPVASSQTSQRMRRRTALGIGGLLLALISSGQWLAFSGSQPGKPDYDLSLLPSTATEIFGCSPKRIHEDPWSNQLSETVKASPLWKYFDPKFEQAFSVTLFEKNDEAYHTVAILTVASGSAMEYARQKFGADKRLSNDGFGALYATDEADQWVRIVDRKTIVVGKADAIEVHRKSLSNRSPQFVSLCEMLDKQSDVAFLLSNNTGQEWETWLNDTVKSDASQLRAFALSTFIRSHGPLWSDADYLAVSVSVASEPSINFFASCSDSNGQDSVFKTLGQLPIALANLLSQMRPVDIKYYSPIPMDLSVRDKLVEALHEAVITDRIEQSARLRLAFQTGEAPEWLQLTTSFVSAFRRTDVSFSK